MGDALKELIEDLWKSEKEYKCEAMYINIHPRWFGMVLSQDKEGRIIVDFNIQAHRFMGRPFIITPKVDKWEIHFKNPQ